MIRSSMAKCIFYPIQPDLPSPDPRTHEDGVLPTINPVISDPSLVEVTQPTAPSKTWGPVLAPRMSARIQRDGRTATQKAAGLKKARNMEIPKHGALKSCIHNFFATLANNNLLDKAKDSGISLGSNDTIVQHNITIIKVE